MKKAHQDTFLVSKSVAFKTLATPAHYTKTDGTVDLLDGQLALLNDANFILGTTPTVGTSRFFRIAQGTPTSNNPSLKVPHPLWNRPIETSHPIYFDEIKAVTKQPFAAGRHAAWIVGSSTTDSVITAKAATTYTLKVAVRSRALEYFHGCEQGALTTVQTVTPDPLGAKPVTYIVYTLGHQLNAGSAAFKGRNLFVAFALATGTVGTEISTLTAGSAVPVWKVGNTTYTVTVTTEMLATLQAAATATGFTRIITIDQTKLNTDDAGGLLIVGLDAPTSYKDEVLERKVAIRVALTTGFEPSTTTRLVVNPYEGEGYGWQLQKIYVRRAGQLKYFNKHDHDPVVNFPSYIDETATYIVYNFLHGDRYRELVLIPSNADAAQTITPFETAVNSLLASANKGSIVTF